MATRLEIPAGDLTREQKASITRATKFLSTFFEDEAVLIAHAIAEEYAASVKRDSPEERADKIVRAANLEEWDIVADELHDDLGGAFEQTAQIVLGKLDISDQATFDLVNERAVAYAEETGADLVTQITETTRDRLRVLVRNAIENAEGVQELQQVIESSEAFSADRAELIARTEIGNAHMAGALEGAKESGLELRKTVLRGSQEFDCEICGDNEDAGDLELGALFPSGDDAPLFHPNCECTLVFHIAKE